PIASGSRARRSRYGEVPAAARSAATTTRDIRHVSHEADERLDDAVVLVGHHCEGALDLVEGELMRGHRRGIHPPTAHQAEEPIHTVTPARAQRGQDLLVRHPHAEGRQRDTQGVRVLAVVADVRDPPARLADADRRLEGLGKAERLDGRVDAYTFGEGEYLVDRFAFGEVDDDIGAVL